MLLLAMDESPANRESKSEEEEEDDGYMGDLSQFLPSDALEPAKLSSSKKVTSSSFPVLPFFVVVLEEFYSLKKERKRRIAFNKSRI